jgi:hypothetical protein
MTTARFKPPPQGISRLIAFAQEREKIRLKREIGVPAPWTDDPILATYRFTNIRRRDDRVSQWIRAHVYLPMEPDPFDLMEPPLLRDFLMFTAWCRWVNWPPTILYALRGGFYPRPTMAINWVQLGRHIERLPGKRWTSAYIIRADNTRPGRPKSEYVCEDVIGAAADLFARLDFSRNTRCSVWLQLREFPGFGGFMAGQVVDDWTWSSHLLERATDHYTWAPMGPGSVRGFNRLLGRPLNQKPGLAEWSSALTLWRDQLATTLWRDQLATSLFIGSDLTVMDLQNVLCEYDKYERTRLGAGRPRARYTPHDY